MLSRYAPAFLALTTLCFADTLTLKNGGTIQGTYMGGDARQVKFAVGDRISNYPVDEINGIQFGPTGPPAAAEQREYRRGPDGLERRADRDRDNPPQQPAGGVQIPAGTALVVRMIDPVDSETDRLGQTYRATVDEPVVVDGQTLIPRGADVVAKLVSDEQSGRLEGRTVLTLDLQQIQINGRMVDISTSTVSQQSGSRGARTGKVVGGATALGAIIGALAGGGRGAAIGAVGGAAAGTGAQVMTKGQRVKIPSETRLTFTLQNTIQG